MRRIVFASFAVAALAGMVAYMAPASGEADGEAAPIFGIKIPAGYRDWRLISVAHEEGSLNDLRAILGNDVAIRPRKKGRFPTRTAPSLPGSPGITSRWRKAKKPLAVSNLSSLGSQKMRFSSWSGTQANMLPPAAGGSRNSTTAKPPVRRCTTPALPATRSSKVATLCSTVTHFESVEIQHQDPNKGAAIT